MSAVERKESDLEVKRDNDDVHFGHFRGKKHPNLNQGRQSVIKMMICVVGWRNRGFLVHIDLHLHYPISLN